MFQVKRWNRTINVGIGIGIGIAITGCAKQEIAIGRDGKTQFRRVQDARVARAKDEKTPKILPATHFAAGRMFEVQGAIPEAIIQYRKAVAVNHNFVNAYVRLGALYSRAGRHENAVVSWKRAVELQPKNAILRNNLGFELMFEKRWSDAEHEFRQAIELRPELARAHVNLGMTLTRLSRFDEAMMCFREVLPEPDAQYNMGLMYRGQRRYRDAAECFYSALRANPEFTAAQSQLATLSPHLDHGPGLLEPETVTPLVSTARPVVEKVSPRLVERSAAVAANSHSRNERRPVAPDRATDSRRDDQRIARTQTPYARITNPRGTVAPPVTSPGGILNWDEAPGDLMSFTSVVENEVRCLEEAMDEMDETLVMADALTGTSFVITIDEANDTQAVHGASPADYATFGVATIPADDLWFVLDETTAYIVDTSPADMDFTLTGVRTARSPTNMKPIDDRPEQTTMEIAFTELADVLAVLDNEVECLETETLVNTAPEAFDVPVDLVGERDGFRYSSRLLSGAAMTSNSSSTGNVGSVDIMRSRSRRAEPVAVDQPRSMQTLAHQLTTIRNEIDCLEAQNDRFVLAARSPADDETFGSTPIEYTSDAGLVPYRPIWGWLEDPDAVSGPPEELARSIETTPRRRTPIAPRRASKPKLVKEKIPRTKTIKPPPKPVTDAREAQPSPAMTPSRDRNLRSHGSWGRTRSMIQRHQWEAFFGELESLVAVAKNEIFDWNRRTDTDVAFRSPFGWDAHSVLFVAPVPRGNENHVPRPPMRDVDRDEVAEVFMAIEPPNGPPLHGNPLDRHPR